MKKGPLVVSGDIGDEKLPSFIGIIQGGPLPVISRVITPINGLITG